MKLVYLAEGIYVNPEFVSSVCIDCCPCTCGYLSIAVNVDGKHLYIAIDLTRDEAEKILQETVDKLTAAN